MSCPQSTGVPVAAVSPSTGAQSQKRLRARWTNWPNWLGSSKVCPPSKCTKHCSRQGQDTEKLPTPTPPAMNLDLFHFFYLSSRTCLWELSSSLPSPLQSIWIYFPFSTFPSILQGISMSFTAALRSLRLADSAAGQVGSCFSLEKNNHVFNKL